MCEYKCRARIAYGRGQRYRCYDLFGVHEAVAKRKPTAAQRAAIEKAQLVPRTCIVCGGVKERPGQYDERQGCWPCVEWAEAYEHRLARDAMIIWARQLLLDDPDAVVILDPETHELHRRIVEVGDIDLAGIVVFESLVKLHLPMQAAHIHGITDALVTDAPTFAEIEPKLWANARKLL